MPVQHLEANRYCDLLCCRKLKGKKRAKVAHATPAENVGPSEAAVAPEPDMVGKRIKVFWPDDNDWFSGRVSEMNGEGRHLVEYDDGDTEWLDLAAEKYEVLADDTGDASGAALELAMPLESRGKKKRKAEEAAAEARPLKVKVKLRAGGASAEKPGKLPKVDTAPTEVNESAAALGPTGKGRKGRRKSETPAAEDVAEPVLELAAEPTGKGKPMSKPAVEDAKGRTRRSSSVAHAVEPEAPAAAGKNKEKKNQGKGAAGTAAEGMKPPSGRKKTKGAQGSGVPTPAPATGQGDAPPGKKARRGTPAAEPAPTAEPAPRRGRGGSADPVVGSPKGGKANKQAAAAKRSPGVAEKKAGAGAKASGKSLGPKGKAGRK